MKNINLRRALENERSTVEDAVADKFVFSIFEILNEEVYSDQIAREQLKKSTCKDVLINAKGLDPNRIFTKDEVKKLCVRYRLRFLSSSYFKGTVPAEALIRMRKLQEFTGQKIEDFRILAPSKAFNLQDCTKDPLLFAHLGGGSYYLLHQWGEDLSWYRGLLVFPFRNHFTIMATIGFLSVFLTVISALVLGQGTLDGSGIALTLWSCVVLTALLACMGFALLKKLNDQQWDDPFYNL